jgi:hypothetical protein
MQSKQTLILIGFGIILFPPLIGFTAFSASGIPPAGNSSSHELSHDGV